MLIQKDNPRGIDYEIAKIQKFVFDQLSAKGWTNYYAYERVYLNENRRDEGGLIPELYTGDSTTTNNDYREVYFNDTHNADSYFVIGNTVSFNGRFVANVGMIFQVDLKDTFPSIVHRADEEAHECVYLALEQLIPQNYMRGLVTGVQNVYEGLNVDKVKLTDMQPCHVFRFNFVINYDYNC